MTRFLSTYRVLSLAIPMAFSIGLALGSGLGAGGCGGLSLRDCRIVGGMSRLEGGFYSVTVLVENRSQEVLDLSQVQFELTTFDSKDQILDREWQFRLKGEIQPFDNDRIPLNIHRNTQGDISRSHVIMKDQSGRVLSEWTVHDAEVQATPASPSS